MKKLISYTLSLSLVLMMGCQPTSNSEENKKESLDIDKQKTLYAVPLAKAKRDIKRFDDLSQEYLKQIPVKAFTIRSVDFLEAMGVENTTPTKYEHVRIYLGMDDDNNYKLFLTPVKGAKLSDVPPKAGIDVILSGPYEGKKEELQDPDGPYVLDFSAPCPNSCPEEEL